MLKLDSINFLDGNQVTAALLLSSLQNMLTVAPPIEVAAIRSLLETGQDSAFTDAAFNQYLQNCLDLPLIQADLTVAEKTLLNTIRLYLNPAPALSCCGGSDIPTSEQLELIMTPRTGSASFEYEVRVAFDGLFDCSIAKLAANMSSSSATIDQADRDLLPLGCVSGKQTFAFAWISFDDDPVGGDFTIQLTFFDENNVELGSPAEIVVTL